MQLTYLGSCLTLRTQATGHGPLRLGDELHLPLPPDASARQIQDGVEAWLRQEARRVIGACLEAEQQRLGGVLPEWTLSFAVQGAWVQETAEGGLRFNWRLIEQTPDVIHQTVAAALAGLSRPGSCGDLWDQPCS